MSDKTYKSFTEARPNAAGTTRILELLRATEPGIIIETPEMVETLNEIVRLSVSPAARDIGPKWLKERPEIVRVSFTSYPQETRFVKGERIERADGQTILTFTEPIDGNGDYTEGAAARAIPYGDPIDCSEDILEPIPKSSATKVLGAQQRENFYARQTLKTSV